MKKEVHYAGFWKRVAVQIMDNLVITFGILIPTGLFLFLMRGASRNAMDLFGSAYLSIIIAGVLLLLFFILNAYLYFSKGKTIGDYAMKTKLVDAKTYEKPAAGKLFGRAAAKFFISSGTILSIPVAIFLVLKFGTESDEYSQATLIMNILLYIWMIYSFGKAGWSKEKQALHDTMSGTRYVEEKQYSGGWTWFANLGPFIGFIVLGAIATIVAAQFSTYFEKAREVKFQAEQAQSRSLQKAAEAAGEYEISDEQPEFELTTEQIEEIQKAFQEQAAQQAATE